MKFEKLLLILILTNSAFARAEMFRTCDQDSIRQQSRSRELQEIVKADQEDRSGPFDSIDWFKILPRDEARRKRVGEIFGEGCFKTAADYSAAALVYQHGNIPDHFFQTFLWAKKAVELGDPSQMWLMAAGIDRYLVNIGSKQLFATQASIPSEEKCWCLDPVENSFPEARRVEYAKRGMTAALQWVNELNKDKPGCEKASICNLTRKNSPVGSVPGFW
jgi:hypothetical protein